jgi:ZIP family zinc transporter
MPELPLLPLLVSLFAGLATGVGGALALALRRTYRSALGAGLGLSGGAMVYVGFVELLPSASEQLGESTIGPRSVAAFFAGVVVIALLDWLVPSAENPHDAVLIEDLREGDERLGELHRLGLFTAVAIAVHNFPEGLTTFYATVHSPAVGVSIGVAIALHNIPEGIAVAIPIYYATRSRKKALGFSLLAGIAEPLGAVLGHFTFGQHLGPRGMGIVTAAVAGIMVFLSLDQLLPNAKRYDSGHESVYGLLVGMLIMALSLVLLP